MHHLCFAFVNGASAEADEQDSFSRINMPLILGTKCLPKMENNTVNRVWNVFIVAVIQNKTRHKLLFMVIKRGNGQESKKLKK